MPGAKVKTPWSHPFFKSHSVLSLPWALVVPHKSVLLLSFAGPSAGG
jgi:hypothetical protein